MRLERRWIKGRRIGVGMEINGAERLIVGESSNEELCRSMNKAKSLPRSFSPVVRSGEAELRSSIASFRKEKKGFFC
jgi:hypothetical protein